LGDICEYARDICVGTPSDREAAVVGPEAPEAFHPLGIPSGMEIRPQAVTFCSGATGTSRAAEENLRAIAPNCNGSVQGTPEKR
jgi:hypothetical protein